MKQSWIIPLFLGLLLGIAVGLGMAARHYSGSAQGTPFLRDFSFSTIATQAGHADWKVLEDKIYDPFTGLGQPNGVARRIVAHAVMSEKEQNGFETRLDNAATAWLTAQKGTVHGMFSAYESATSNHENGAKMESLINAPRRFYMIDRTRGVMDVSCVGVNGYVTVVISLIEGP